MLFGRSPRGLFPPGCFYFLQRFPPLPLSFSEDITVCTTYATKKKCCGAKEVPGIEVRSGTTHYCSEFDTGAVYVLLFK